MKLKLPLEKQCKIAGLPEPITEYKFHPKRKWRLDYFFPSLKLAVEKEGAVWIGGRHNHPVGFLKDVEKYNELTLSGIALMRFTPQQIQSGEAIFKILIFSQSETPPAGAGGIFT